MRKRHFPWILAGVLVVSYAVAGVVGLVLAAIGLFIAYLLSLRVHPRMRHGRCNGTGEHHGAVFTWTHRRCSGRYCQGGRQVRWGAGIWGAEHVRHERTRVRQASESAKSSGSWR